jgi:hypothetical protein
MAIKKAEKATRIASQRPITGLSKKLDQLMDGQRLMQDSMMSLSQQMESKFARVEVVVEELQDRVTQNSSDFGSLKTDVTRAFEQLQDLQARMSQAEAMRAMGTATPNGSSGANNVNVDHLARELS